MKKGLIAGLIASHLLVGVVGFATGIYTLPILTAANAPDTQQLASINQNAIYEARFDRDRAGSDALHWGEGKVSLSQDFIALEGELSAGPDFKIYLAPDFVEDEAQFNQLKSQMQLIGDVKSFDGFAVELPNNVDLSQYNTVIIWCETFGEFITSAQYR
ncbi:DM13 domain-containing protein [Shewanella maritima]|uniref:DM13 domain-containing protein n=1 Tax=Shewanella maritima TaxID=2520507 RepID=UPI003736CD21